MSIPLIIFFHIHDSFLMKHFVMMRFFSFNGLIYPEVMRSLTSLIQIIPVCETQYDWREKMQQAVTEGETTGNSP